MKDSGKDSDGAGGRRCCGGQGFDLEFCLRLSLGASAKDWDAATSFPLGLPRRRDLDGFYLPEDEPCGITLCRTVSEH